MACNMGSRLTWILIVGVAGFFSAANAKPLQVQSVAIVTGANASGPELKAAEILSKRLVKRSGAKADVVVENAEIPAADITIAVGTGANNNLVSKWAGEFGAELVKLPNSDQVHPEGFAVKSGAVDGKPGVVVTGADGRGVIYGVGWLLRALTYKDGFVEVPESLDRAEKPAFWMRGGNPHGAGSRAREYGQLRDMTGEEHQEIMEDQMLLGTNVFGGNPDNMRSTYGMLTAFGRTANEMHQDFQMPDGWGADDGRSFKYVCPSVPEARKALLESFDEFFKTAPKYDFFTTNSGDEGGCRCDRCEPWGGTYIKLLREIADLLHKYQPDCKILATNQDLTPEGNLAIFDFLNSGDASWLYALRYGPGADEMQTYIRGAVNPRWFEYEGFGALGNYLKYIHHELPRTTHIALYSDITHWMQAQYAVEQPDIALAAVYDRRSWNMRPRNFHKVGREIFHYAIGDMHYSEGLHDDFNKWFWYQFMWNPELSAEEITRNYCRYWFGPEAEEEMVKAIFLMEETLEKPVLGNPGIAQAVELVRSAGNKIPANLLKTDWRWRVISEKALMDNYIQLALERGEALKEAARQALASVDTAPRQSVEAAVKALDQPMRTEAMQVIYDEALARSEEANTIGGYREPVVFIVDELDLSEALWWKDVLQQALQTPEDAKLKNTAQMVLQYDNPGEGGFYDDVGWPAQPEHLVSGHTLWTFRPLPGPSRHSQWNVARARRNAPVKFAYDHLDPQAQYVVRVAAGSRMRSRPANAAPLDADRAARLRAAMQPMKQRIDADGATAGEAFEVPRDHIGYFEYEVPKAATEDGKLEITMVSETENTFSGASVSEIWLMKKDNMPWTTAP